jgi:hypothetical protein
MEIVMDDTAEDKKRKALLQRVRGLMAKTTANGCTEAEAQAAAAMVDRLVGEYEIDLTETLVGEQEVIQLDIELNHHPVRFAASRIGEFCDCRVWYNANQGRNDLCVLGFEIDVEIAEYLLLLFQRAIDREASQYSVFNPEFAMADTTLRNTMLQSFNVGMATRLGDRLREMKSKRDFAQKEKRGFDLVLAKKPIIDLAWASLGLNLSKDKYGASHRHAGAYEAGQSAANKVAINPGVGGGAGNSGRIK